MARRFAIVAAILGSVGSSPVWSQASAAEKAVFALESRVVAGDTEAMRTILRMNTDGAVAEFADIILGKSIRRHPKAFLEVMASEPKGRCQHCLDGKLGNLGDEYVERFSAEIQKLKMRRESIALVTDASLRSIRDRCIEILDSQIRQVEAALAHEAVEPAMTPN